MAAGNAAGRYAMQEDRSEPILQPPGEDRRQWVRYPIRLAVSCRIGENAERSSWLGQIQNVSHGGVKILCRRPVEPGTMILVSPADSRLLPRLARVLHTINGSDGNWILGCAFRELVDERELLAWLKSQNGKPRVA